MNIRNAMKKAALTAIFAAVIVSVFWLTLKKLTDNVMYSTFAAGLAAIALRYFYYRYVYEAVRELKHAKKAKLEAKGFHEHHEHLEEKIRKLTAELSSANLKLKAEIANRPLDQRKLQQRLKHLNCLYGLSKIVHLQEISLEQIFQEMVNLIREAYQYPNAMCVRITFDGIPYETDNFRKSELSQYAPIKARRENVGAIRIYYLGTKVEDSEGPFLKEESDLLNAIAKWLGTIVERKEVEEELRLFRNLIDQSNDCIFVIEPKWGRFSDVNSKACDSLRYTREELLDLMTIEDIEESMPNDSSWQEQIKELKLKTDIVKESWYLRKDGTRFPVEASLKLVTQEKQDYIIAIARDITERKRAETELETAHKQLVETARRVGMAEVATGVLHNVGNVLNSVSVTTASIQKSVRDSKVSYLTEVVSLLEEHTEGLVTFMTTDEGGKKLPVFLANLSKELIDEQGRFLEALETLTKHIEHTANIIQLQQSYSKTTGLTEPVSISEVVEDTFRINADALTRHSVGVKRELADLPPVLFDRHKILQILTNLISNAIKALSKSGQDHKALTIRVKEPESGHFRIEVSDNGIGIAEENLTRIFKYNFTTSEDGHGFGLHSAALTANEMNGSLSAHSDGPGKGTVFTLELPFKTQETTK